MARSSQYRRTVSEISNWSQQQALNSTIFILREIGPTGFLLQEDGDSKKHKVLIGDPHSCTCPSFRKDHDLCKHICWLLLRKFRLKEDDPLSWQLGLVEREINSLLYQKPPQLPPPLSDTTNPQTDEPNGETETKSSVVAQRPIAEGDICPICQEELLESRLPVTYCRQTCGNNVHLRCMKVWTDHQKKQKQIGLNDSVSCPFCRGDFALMSHLLKEQSLHQSSHCKQSQERDHVSVHTGTECDNCQATPIRGKLYKCQICTHYLLCAQCFNQHNVHTDHDFNFREKSNSRWQIAPRTRSLPQALVTSLQNRELTNMDYDLLLQLETPGTGSDIRQSDLQCLKSWRIRDHSYLLSPGHQCRVCLMCYRVGELVRKLPSCNHIFHADCLDPWLLHRRPNCPLDGEIVIIPNKSSTVNQEDSPAERIISQEATSLMLNDTISNLNVSGLRLSAHSNRMAAPSEGTLTSDVISHSSSSQVRQPRTLPPLNQKVTRKQVKSKSSSVEIQHSSASIPFNNKSNAGLFIGNNNNLASETIDSTLNESRYRSRQKSTLSAGLSFSRSRSISASRKERERAKSYAGDPRLQKAIRDMELYATSYNIHLRK